MNLQSILFQNNVQAYVGRLQKNRMITRHEVMVNDPREVYKIIPQLQLHLDNDVEVSLGKGVVYVDVPNRDRGTVGIKSILQKCGRFEFPIGIDLQGNVVKLSLGKMVHMCIAGTTGSGKTTAMKSIIAGMAALESPHDLQFDIIDMKGDLRIFRDLPHVRRVVSKANEGVMLLRSCISEIERRFESFHDLDTYDIDEYNEVSDEPICRLVVIIDELAVLASSNKEANESIKHITAIGRACGVHLIVGTQSPRADIVSKSNFTTILAFRTTNKTESNILIGGNGCETLLGNGDGMLISSNGDKLRFQGCYVSNKEIKALVTMFPPKEVYHLPKPIMAPIMIPVIDQIHIEPDEEEAIEEAAILVDSEKEKDEYIMQAITEHYFSTKKALSIDKIRSEYNVGTSRAIRLRKASIGI